MFDFTRQAYNQYLRREKTEFIESDFIIDKVKEIRYKHPKIGGRKLYFMIQTEIQKTQIKIGRDKFFKILSSNNLLIKKVRKQVKTTFSWHWLRKYKNLIKDKKAEKKNAIWVSDITYWNIGERFLYINFITDTYSRKIVGYSVSETMTAEDILPSLAMALSQLNNGHKGLIHHSDRGIQYCSNIYTKMLKSHDIDISMTENGDPLENALAERINGIMKEEYLKNLKVDNITKARIELEKAIDLYNNHRPHLSCNYYTPNQVHEDGKIPKVRWKNYYNSTKGNLFQDQAKSGNLC